MQLRPTPHRRAPRVALHLMGVTVLAGSGILLTGAPGHAADATRPDSYGGDATASALHFLADRNPQPTPVTDLIHVDAPYATSSMDSSGSATASATPLYPGAGLLGVPALLCQVGACPPLPGYPPMATASYPTKPDAQAQASPTLPDGPLRVTPNLAAAHADPNRVEATTEAAGISVSGAFSVDSASTLSRQAFEGGTLVVTATSTVKGIDLGAGALHIDAVRSVAVAHVDGATVTTSSATTTVTGATAGGTPVTIDSTGIHVPGNGDGGQVGAGANGALSQLDASGIKVRLLAPTRAAKDGTAEASTGGLLVTFAQTVNQRNPVPSVPVSPPNGDYFGSLTIGGVGVTAFAAPALDVTVPWVNLPRPTAGVPGTGLAPVQGAVAPAAAAITGMNTGPALGAARTAPQPGAAGATPASRPVAVLGVDLTGQRLRLLALALLGYPGLVLLTAPVLKGRPRRPRTR